MSNEIFLSAIERLTSTNLTLNELIQTADRLRQEGQSEQVLQIYNLWIKSNQDHPQRHMAQFNYAVSQSEAGDNEGARASLEAALQQNEDFYPAYINLGSALERLGRAGEAVVTWTNMANKLGGANGQAVMYRLMAMKQIARVLEMNRLLPNAEQILRQSLEINVHQQDVIQHYVAMRMAQCEWPVVQAWEGMDPKILLKGTGPLSMAVYTDDPMLQCASAWHYAKGFLKYPDHDLTAQHAPKPKSRPKKLRIGYVSSDLRNHAVGYIMAELFGLHDRERYETIAYYCGTAPQDELTERIRGSIDQWVDITRMSDEVAAKRILEDAVDILVDVNGYTKDARTRIFALRPAPIIVNWLGFPGTMGSPYHQYIIADEVIIPPAHEKYFTEKVVRLPCYQPNDRQRAVSPHTPTRASVGLPEEAFVFCSFNGVQKISRFTFDRWLRILKQVPNSVLWLLDAANGIDARLRAYAEKQGIAPERFIFAPKENNPEHLARYVLADLFLDNQPYGAHVTASDALWMGVPILTLCGRGFAARVSSSLVRAAGMPELVCHSEDEFIERAVALGKDMAEVRRLKMKLAANRDSCLLFDTPKLVVELEKLYDGMYADYLAGNLPVPDLRNMDVYLEIGAGLDHEATETRAVANYDDMYRQQLAKRHDYHPLSADGHLWTEDNIQAHEGSDKKPAKARTA